MSFMGDDDVVIGIEVDGAREAKRELDNVGENLDDLGGRFDGLGGKAGAAGGAVVAGIMAMVAVGLELRETGLELDLMSQRVDTVFGESASTVRDWADDVNRELGTSDQRVAGLAANMGDLLVPMGIVREDAADMSMKAVEVAGALDLWSTESVSVEDALGRIQSAMLGQREGLEALGIKITDAQIKAELAARGMDDLAGSELQAAIAGITLDLVMGQSGDAIAFAGSEAAETQLQARELSARFTELKDDLAERFLPVAIAVGDWILDAADWIESDMVPAVQDFAASLEPTIAFIYGLYDAAMVVLGPLIDLADKLGILEGATQWLTNPVGAGVGLVTGDGAGQGIIDRAAEQFGISPEEAAALVDGGAPDDPWANDPLWGSGPPTGFAGKFSMGGDVRAARGPQLIVAGEGGEDEVVMTAQHLQSLTLGRSPGPTAHLGGDTYVITVTESGNARMTADEVADAIDRYQRRNRGRVSAS